LFKIQTDGTGFKTLRAFSVVTGLGPEGEGANPTGGLILSGGTLYGTTYNDGQNHTGNVFKIGINGMGYATLVNFDPTQCNGIQATNATGENPILPPEHGQTRPL
jgi:uncharacterized repeat protein (TIGR03803 family)